jgi:hypothetical protein
MRVISGEIGIGHRFTGPSLRRRVGARLQVVCVATIVVLCATACSSSSSGTTGGPKPGPNLITADEIARVNVQNVYEVVQKLRPSMLRPRQAATANAQAKGELIVYMDNHRLGNVEQLRQISSSSVAALRYYSAAEAQTKWGSGHPGGVIEILTKR